MTELSTRGSKIPAIDYSRIPERVNVVIDVRKWVGSILAKTPYEEPNPDFISTMIAFQTITAQTVEEVFDQQGVKKLQEMLPNTPGATTGPVEITDLYVASSDFETGNPSYVIITTVHLETGEEAKFTTGATNVQATILGLLLNGMWPIRCQIKRGDSKDRGGRYLMFVLPPD
jgi:hypothetical protein